MMMRVWHNKLIVGPCVAFSSLVLLRFDSSNLDLHVALQFYKSVGRLDAR